MKRGNEEARICCAFWRDVQVVYPKVAPHLTHVPSGGYRRPETADLLKRMGTRRGVSDYFVGLPVGDYPAIWIEVKTETGRPEPEQVTWLRMMRECGFAAVCVYGWDDLWDTFSAYVDGNHGLIAMQLSCISRRERRAWKAVHGAE